MIRFTAQGAVQVPDTVQVRWVRWAAKHHAPAVSGPAPSRDMLPSEVLDNVRHVVVDAAGPRRRPVRRVVLAGLPVGRPDPSVEALAEGLAALRPRHVSEVVVHVSAHRSPDEVQAWSTLLGADHVVLRGGQHTDWGTWTSPLPAPFADKVRWSVAWPVQGRLAGQQGPPVALRGRTPGAVVWPFHRAAPTPGDLQAVQAWARGSKASLVGVPPCLLVNSPLGASRRPAHRTQNRWMVDADHQRAAARHFFPDRVARAMPDRCRGCAHYTRCDGVPVGWLRDDAAVKRMEPQPLGDGDGVPWPPRQG